MAGGLVASDAVKCRVPITVSYNARYSGVFFFFFFFFFL
jgi:hypothetical protein